MIWNSSTYKIEDTLSHGLERVWAVSYTSDTKLALGKKKKKLKKKRI